MELRSSKYIALASLFISAGLTLVMYGRAVCSPLYSDDLLVVPWVKGTSLLDLWRTASPYGAYRPLHFTLRRLLYLVAGDLRPDLLYSLNLIGHALCGTLVGLLASRWGRGSWLAAPLTASLFVLFPFAFGVVLWPAAFSYPLATALALGAVLTYLRARESGTIWHHLLAVALTSLSGFAFEGGIVTGLSILWAEMTLVKGRVSRWPAIHIAASLLPLLPNPRLSAVASGFVGLPQSALDVVVALQVVAFPVAPMATMARRVGLDPVLTMGLAGIAALCVVGFSASKRGHLRWFWFGLGWAVLWASIPLGTQNADWPKWSLRALYPSAVGTAVIWGVGLCDIPPHYLGRWRSPLCVALLVATLIPPVLFIRGRMELHQRAGALLWEVISAVDGEDAPILFVNLPARITPAERFYPLGHEGVIPMTPPTSADSLVRAHGGRAGVAFERFLGDILPQLPYSVGLAGARLSPEDLRIAGRVYAVKYRPDEMRLEQAGAVLAPGEARSAVAQFGEHILLLSASCHRDGQGGVILSTLWQAVGLVEGGPTVFAHLLRDDGSLITQADGNPMRGLFPFTLWKSGEVVRDVRSFDALAPGPVTVAFGVWEPALGVRWKAIGANGDVLPEYSFRCEVVGQ